MSERYDENRCPQMFPSKALRLSSGYYKCHPGYGPSQKQVLLPMGMSGCLRNPGPSRIIGKKDLDEEISSEEKPSRAVRRATTTTYSSNISGFSCKQQHQAVCNSICAKCDRGPQFSGGVSLAPS
ncbi:hypothetical protein BDDG_12352 [Blastomyces dermatitidis ATCC 18188]|uniref:Uncharacterized protein n=1 Tax=Ajellomyces dermatitidis (strain ATCC 18188 / CBS 674.68) TaxID=653446 RepID=A0A0J9EP68_AJEDA|nr:hypothetical protein BDDG_12352 [Blastomyces dermatitidis ATCC 18188]